VRLIPNGSPYVPDNPCYFCGDGGERSNRGLCKGCGAAKVRQHFESRWDLLCALDEEGSRMRLEEVREAFEAFEAGVRRGKVSVTDF